MLYKRPVSFLGFPLIVIRQFSVCDINHKPSERFRFAVFGNYGDHLVNPFNAALFCYESVLKLMVLKCGCSDHTCVSGTVPVIFMQIVDPEILFIPVIDRVAQEFLGLRADVCELKRLGVGLPWDHICGFDQESEVFPAFSERFS